MAFLSIIDRDCAVDDYIKETHEAIGTIETFSQRCRRLFLQIVDCLA